MTFPLKNKKETLVHLANKVNYAMLGDLNVAQMEHSFGDLMISSRESEIGVDLVSTYTIGMSYLENVVCLSMEEVGKILDIFITMGPTRI